MPTDEQGPKAQETLPGFDVKGRLAAIPYVKTLRRAANLAMYIKRKFPDEDQLEVVKIAVKAIWPELSIKEADHAPQ